MPDEAEEAPVGGAIRTPSYNDLVSMVELLRAQLDDRRGVADTKPPPREPVVVPEFRVVPDLNKTINSFSGRETVHQAEDWLNSVDGIASMNGWPLSFRIQFVRANIQGSARDWFAGRTFNDWADFERQFRATYVRKKHASDRWDVMRARVQGRHESVMEYFQSKVRLCRDLSLPFEEIRDHVLRSTNCREMALYAMGKVHTCEEEVLEDLLDWTRMNDLHVEESLTARTARGEPRVSAYRAPKTAHVQPVRPVEDGRATSGTGVASAAVANRVMWTRAPAGRSLDSPSDPDRPPGSPTCWTCKRAGHLSRDCPSRRRPTCYECGAEGHMRPNCPNKGQTSVAEVARESRNHPYRKLGLVNGRKVDVLLDTGSHHNLLKASVAIRCGLQPRPVERALYGLGSTTVPSMKTVGEVLLEIVVDGVSAGEVLALVVPDEVQRPDVIVGRSWLDAPTVAYRKENMSLYLYKAEPVADVVEPTVTVLGTDAEYLHVVEAVENTVPEPLVETDFAHVNREVSDSERADLLALVNEFRDCFAKNLSELGCTPLISMNINEEPNSRPVACRPYKTSAADREEIAKIVAEWKEHGLVEETQSPYASPVLLVKQAGGKNRLCVDYRRLNKQTVRQHFPLPDMIEQLESLAGSKMFTQLDLASGYLQIPMTAEASEKTAFITADTTGQFSRMPFGLSGAVAEFTRLMQHVLGPLRGKIVRNYLDDMVIDGVNWGDMLSKLRLVLERLRHACLTLKPSKCSFGCTSIEFLGFIVEDGKIRPGLEKTNAIAAYPAPTDVHAIRRFLGLTGFFRRFVNRYAFIAEPLTRLTRKDAVFEWTKLQENAFNQLRKCLTEAPVLTMFRADAAAIELHTDASAAGLGAMLLQATKAGDPLHLVYCASRKTSEAETRYHSSKLELLCVVWAMNKLRQFLLGVSFTVYTDCQALVYLNSYKNTNSQVARWHDTLQEFDYSVKYRPGIRMGHVDALSRAPVDQTIEGAEAEEKALGDRYDVCVMLTEEERVLMSQTVDKEVAHLVDLAKESPEGVYRDYVLVGGLLYKNFSGRRLFVMPTSMRKSLVVVAHDLSGHPSVDGTMANLLQDFWFAGMRRYVKQHIHMCFECLLAKNPRGKRPGLLHPIPIGRRPFETIHMDHVGPFVTTPGGNKYVLAMVDNLTKFVKLYAVESVGTGPLLASVEDFIMTYGLPRLVITDRGTCYTSGNFLSYCEERGIRLVWTSSRHPQANGQVERVHSVVMATLRTLANDPDGWDADLPEVQRVINNSESKVTTRTPFELLHGYRPRFHLGRLRAITKTSEDWMPPEELREVAREKQAVQKAKMKEAYDRHRHDNTHYVVGEIVVMKRAPNCTGESTKLQDRYRGPLVVTEILDGDTYRVEELDSAKKSRFATTAHVSQLKSWKLSDEDGEQPGTEPVVQKEAPPVPKDAEEVAESESLPSGDQGTSCGELKDARPKRVRPPPVWARDYEMS